MNTPRIQPSTVWFAVIDSTILERVVVLSTFIFPPYGKYILYRRIDWPDSAASPYPSVLHESVFADLYTPQETPCETIPSENSSSKISLPRPLPWYTALVVQWGRITSSRRKSW